MEKEKGETAQALQRAQAVIEALGAEVTDLKKERDYMSEQHQVWCMEFQKLQQTMEGASA